MIDKLIDTYGMFSDAIIKDIKISSLENNTSILEMNILACNTQTNQYEYLFIEYIEVTVLKIDDKSVLFAPSDILISVNEENILFDFFPIDHFDYLEENPNSIFKLKCKSIEYRVIKPYTI